MAWNVLARNGVVQLQDPGPPLPFLRSQPPGAYTTTRSSDNASFLLFWARHLERLAQSVKLVSKGMPQLFPCDAEDLPDFDSFVKSMVQPSLSIGLQKALAMRKDEEELLVMAYITGATEKSEEIVHSEEHKGFDIYVHISRCLPTHPENVVKCGVQLAVMGLGRFLPNAKHTEWVRTRQALEKRKPEGVTEIILSDDGDLLLEGLVTNFFVVISNRKDNVMETSTDEAKKWEGFVVQTAPLKGVLPGVVRKLILEICVEHGIPYGEVSPSWRDRHLWVEAFITNSARLIEPVSSIRCPVHWESSNEPQDWGQETWEHCNLQIPGSVTQFIQSQILEKSSSYSVSIDSLMRDSY